MSAITAKVTFFVRYKQAGCSFSLYKKPDTLKELVLQSPIDKLSPIDRFVDSYVPLLGAGVEVPYVRISNEALKGDSEFYDRPRIAISTGSVNPASSKTRQVKTVTSDESDFYNTAVNVVLYASSTQKGRMFMRFVPDNIINYPVGLNPEGEWVKAFDRWKAVVAKDGWCIRALADYTTAPEKVVKNITRTVAGANLLVTTDGAHGIAPGKTVRISRSVPETTFKNGLYICDSTLTPDTMLLRNTPGSQLTVATAGTVRRHELEFVPIIDMSARNVTGRKAGRPFGLPVGRRKVHR